MLEYVRLENDFLSTKKTKMQNRKQIRVYDKEHFRYKYFHIFRIDAAILYFEFARKAIQDIQTG